jgi:hypothetical protein
MTQSDTSDSRQFDAFDAGYIAGLGRRARQFRWLSIAFFVLAVLWLADTVWIMWEAL